MLPSPEVTTTVMVLLPTLKLIAEEKEPLVTNTPFTFTVAPASATVGFIVVLVTLLATVSA